MTGNLRDDLVKLTDVFPIFDIILGLCNLVLKKKKCLSQCALVYM